MLYIPNCCTSAAYNQAFEQVAFEEFTKGDILLVWRNSPAVVCGRNQNIFAETDIIHTLQSGVSIVRRDTGGGCVYHDLGNVNYAIISDSNGLNVSYDRFLDTVIEALRYIGVPAHRNKACDIAIDGMKISGSAQRQTKDRVLHHGTLLFGTNIDALFEFLPDKSSGFSSKSIASNRSKVTNISLHTSAFSSTEDFMNKFVSALIDRENGAVCKASDEHIKKASELTQTKYEAWDWTYGKNPAFSRTVNKSGLSLEYSSKRGRITELVLKKGNEQVVSASTLLNARLERREIEETCREAFGCNELASDVFHMIFDYNSEDTVK